MNDMNEVITTILDNVDFEKHEELDMTKQEHDLIISRYQKELSAMKIDEFISCVMEESYRLGYCKACIEAGKDIPM
jgi:uridine kinase